MWSVHAPPPRCHPLRMLTVSASVKCDTDSYRLGGWRMPWYPTQLCTAPVSQTLTDGIQLTHRNDSFLLLLLLWGRPHPAGIGVYTASVAHRRAAGTATSPAAKLPFAGSGAEPERNTALGSHRGFSASFLLGFDGPILTPVLCWRGFLPRICSPLRSTPAPGLLPLSHPSPSPSASPPPSVLISVRPGTRTL